MGDAGVINAAVPLTGDLTAKLKELYKVRYLYEPHVFLVNGYSVSSIKTAFNAACRRAKIERFPFLKRYKSFWRSMKDLAHRFNAHIPLAHRVQNLESQNFVITVLVRP